MQRTSLKLICSHDGLSLVELITVMVIIGTLLAISTLNFNQMSRKYAINNQTRELYSDLMDLRLKAFYSKRSHVAKVTASTFEAYSSVDPDGNPLGLSYRKNLSYPITWKPVSTETSILFTSQGLTTDWLSLCVSETGNSGIIDSVVISMARINMGKRKPGGECKGEDVNVD